MTRHDDWMARLTRYVASVWTAPFAPGVHDCGLFAAGAVDAQTGVDLAAAYRGRYTTTRGGLRVLRRDGYADHVALAAAHLRTRSQHERARPGDLAVIPTGEGSALGVVQGEGVYVLSPTGIISMPISSAIFVLEVP